MKPPYISQQVGGISGEIKKEPLGFEEGVLEQIDVTLRELRKAGTRGTP